MILMSTRAVVLGVSLLAACSREHDPARVSVQVATDKVTVAAYDAQAAADAAERRRCAEQVAAVVESRRRSLEQEEREQERQRMERREALRRQWSSVVRHAAGALAGIANRLQRLQQCRSVATLRVGKQVVRLIHSGTDIVDIRTGAMAAITQGDKGAWTVTLNGAAPLVLRRGETAWLGWSTDMRPVTILAVDPSELARVQR